MRAPRILAAPANYTGDPDPLLFRSITCKVPNETVDRGNAASMEDAMQVFKARWLVVSANGPPKLS